MRALSATRLVFRASSTLWLTWILSLANATACRPSGSGLEDQEVKSKKGVTTSEEDSPSDSGDKSEEPGGTEGSESSDPSGKKDGKKSSELPEDEMPESGKLPVLVELPSPLCRTLPPVPSLEDRTVAHWFTIDEEMLGESERPYSPVDMSLSASRIDIMTARRPLVVDISKNSVCAYVSPFGDKMDVEGMLPLNDGKDLLVYFEGVGAAMGRYSENGTRFRGNPAGSSATASQFLRVKGRGSQKDCIAAEFGDHRLQISFDEGQNWTPFDSESIPDNYGLLVDRNQKHLWTYGILNFESMDLEWYSTADLLNYKTAGQIIDFGDDWESSTLEAAIAHPHKDSMLIVGSGTFISSGPIVGEIGLDANDKPVPMKVIWAEGESSSLDGVRGLWADPEKPGRIFVGGPAKKDGGAPLLVLQDGKFEREIPFPDDRRYELNALEDLGKASAGHKGTLLAATFVDHQIELYVVRTRPASASGEGSQGPRNPARVSASPSTDDFPNPKD